MTKDECLDIIRQNDAKAKFVSFLGKYRCYRSIATPTTVWVHKNKIIAMTMMSDGYVSLFIRPNYMELIKINTDDVMDYKIIPIKEEITNNIWDDWKDIMNRNPNYRKVIQ